MSAEQANAIVQPQIDQMVEALRLQMAQTALGQGLQVGQQGLTALTGAGGAIQTQAGLAGSLLDPIMKEYQLMLTALNGLMGNFPGFPGGAGPPPAPVA